ncbi:MAG TPA: hypothetical protein VMU61_12185 [Candidatus Aquilonibacter sp.]|nr:hypothetical protein [Candidatus Aquilonibacter sp.]
MMRLLKANDARLLVLVTCLLLNTAGSAEVPAAPPVPMSTALDQGFAGLYNLDFAGAQKDFRLWESEHPDDPVGPVSEAAGYLFSEFSRLGVLEAQFYENDSAFASRPKLDPDPAVRDRFESALGRSETLARARLVKDPNDRDALFAMTLSSGLQADYAALIEKRNLVSLHYTKEASIRAQRLLAICSDCHDALLATGFSKYIIGSMAAPLRWLLRMDGLPGDRQAGIADLQLTAEHGHYLAPFARILLAIAYVRQKDKAHALAILNSLRADFPGNTLFPKEIARLQASH